MLTRRRVIAAKIEATEGTAETLGASDGGILALDPKVDVNINMNERRLAAATLSRFQSVPGSRSATISFRIELKGAGNTGAPELGKYLRACGFAETIDMTPGSEKAIYEPASSGVPSLTIGCYEDGVLKTLAGCRGNVKIIGKVGELVFLEFEFTGLWAGLTDTALLSPTYEATVPPVLLSAATTIGAYSPVIAGFELDMANTLQLREDVAAASGFRSALITDRKPAGRFDPEMTTAADHDWFGKWQSGTAAALSIGPIGSTQYNRATITAPRILYTKVADSERTGLAVADTSFELAMDSGDDELKITFD